MEQAQHTQTAVVFGPNGMVGKQLVLQLIKETTISKIRVFTRQPLDFEHEKVVEIHADFNDWNNIESHLFPDDIVFCCIGTTMKKAGSKDKFRAVDLEIPVKIAHHGKQRDISKLIVVSSMGADEYGKTFYLRTKGEMEEQVRQTGPALVSFVRPSLLLGNREEFRLGEKIGASLMKTFSFAMKGKYEKYKAIDATDVAKAMIRIAGFTRPKMVYESDELKALVTQ